MYKFLLFDADDTIFDFLKAEAVAFKQAMEESGLVYKEEYVEIYSEVNLKMWQELERKEITKPELIRTRFDRFFKKVGIEADSTAMRENYQVRLGQQGFLLPGAVEMLEKLYTTGKYRIFLITNGLKDTQTGRLERSGISKFLEGVFISEEVGHEKPSAEYFNAVEKAITGFDRSQALVIGDSLTSDILGGNNAGIDTVWYNFRNKSNNTKAVPTYTIKDLTEIYTILGE
ncbi:MAG: YjjG family noncanonical pyrimidine nucleotidase [Lachnospiraceae bacterium]|nr:YjjG family noncanonical pyrimidine nucleotidase [Lachnospiraceae bacterium]